MLPEKQLELHIPSVLGYEKVAMDFSASVPEMMGFGDNRIGDLKTAVSEACLNAIEHAHKADASMRVGIILRACRETCPERQERKWILNRPGKS